MKGEHTTLNQRYQQDSHKQGVPFRRTGRVIFFHPHRHGEFYCPYKAYSHTHIFLLAACALVCLWRCFNGITYWVIFCLIHRRELCDMLGLVLLFLYLVCVCVWKKCVCVLLRHLWICDRHCDFFLHCILMRVCWVIFTSE